MHRLINPNLHAILIHYPLGLITVGVLIELLAFLWRRSGFRAAGRWMILIGTLATIPAATSGMYAAYDAMGGEMGQHWVDFKQDANADAEHQHQWHLLSDHVTLNASAAAVLAFVVVTWLGCSDLWRGRLHLLFLLLLLFGMWLIIAGAWHGGEMVYSHGVAVHARDVSSEQSGEHGGSSAAASSDKPLEKAIEKVRRPTEKAVDTIDLHTTMAGWTVAFALVSLGLSIRRLSTAPRVVVRTDVDLGDLGPRDTLVTSSGEPVTPVRPRSPAQELLETTDLPTDDRPVARVPASRFWLIAALLGALTALGGWVIVEPESIGNAFQLIRDHPRYLAHTSAAVAIIGLSIILAATVRWSRSRFFLMAFSLLLLVAIAAQVWFGFLLLYDSREGSPMHLNGSASSSTPTSPTTAPSTAPSITRAD